MSYEKELDKLEEERINKDLKDKIKKTTFEQLLAEYKNLNEQQDKIIQQLKENQNEGNYSGIEVWKFKISIDDDNKKILTYNKITYLTKKCRELSKQRVKLVNSASLLSRQINKLKTAILEKAKS